MGRPAQPVTGITSPENLEHRNTLSHHHAVTRPTKLSTHTQYSQLTKIKRSSRKEHESDCDSSKPGGGYSEQR